MKRSSGPYICLPDSSIGQVFCQRLSTGCFPPTIKKTIIPEAEPNRSLIKLFSAVSHFPSWLAPPCLWYHKLDQEGGHLVECLLLRGALWGSAFEVLIASFSFRGYSKFPHHITEQSRQESLRAKHLLSQRQEMEHGSGSSKKCLVFCLGSW